MNDGITTFLILTNKLANNPYLIVTSEVTTQSSVADDLQETPNGLAMGKPDKVDSLVDYLPGEGAGLGGSALDLQTMQDCIAQKG